MRLHFVGEFSKEEKEALESLEERSFLAQLYKTEDAAVVENPKGSFSPFAFYPLAPKQAVEKNILVILTDMDGTTTSTERLCLHSLEYTMRKITKTPFSFRKEDYPNIIGNSTTKHIEYLLERYKKRVSPGLLREKGRESAEWILKNSPDAKRKMIAADTLRTSASFRNIAREFETGVRLAIEIYYARYHLLLEEIKKGRAEKLAQVLTKGDPLIKPMPGISLFLSLLTGLLKEEEVGFISSPIAEDKKKALARFFGRRRIKIGLVTSSILYETEIVMSEVFKRIQEEVKEWRIGEKKKELLLGRFLSYQDFYDTVVTADDSSEFRLKPHPDLYTIALFNLGIRREEYPGVLGFEDSTAGVIALRAAGVGRVVAVPFAESSTHDFSAATWVCKKGILEFLDRFAEII